MKAIRHLLLISAFSALSAVQSGSSHAAESPLITSRPNARTLPLPKSDDVFHFAIYGDRTAVDERLTIPERILPLTITKTIHDTPGR